MSVPVALPVPQRSRHQAAAPQVPAVTAAWARGSAPPGPSPGWRARRRAPLTVSSAPQGLLGAVPHPHGGVQAGQRGHALRVQDPLPQEHRVAPRAQRRPAAPAPGRARARHALPSDNH